MCVPEVPKVRMPEGLFSSKTTVGVVGTELCDQVHTSFAAMFKHGTDAAPLL